MSCQCSTDITDFPKSVCLSCFNRYIWQKTERPQNLFSTKNWSGMLMKWQCVGVTLRVISIKKMIPIKFTTFIFAFNISFYLKSVPKCPVSALMLKKIPGAASCMLCLLIVLFFWWNRIHPGGTLSPSRTPKKLIGLRHFWESLY